MKLSNPLTRKWNFTALSFAFPCVGMLVVMLISGYIPFGKTSMLYSDMYHQYYPFFLAFRHSLRQGQSLLYNWSIGMGVDYLGLISYYLASPLNLLSVLLPEKGLLGIRAAMGLYTNLRPAKLYPALKDECPLRSDIVAQGFDLMMVRELTGGIYFGERGHREGQYGAEAYDTERYSVMEIERIARAAFDAARKRRKNVISIDKANVLETSRLWRETVHRIAQEYPDVTVSDMLVDNAAMQLVRRPSQFDVVVTSNMFGDILSDEASQITGSIGMLPSASLGATKRGLYEPIHGSAPDIAGQNKANPIATILSAAMMLRYAFDMADEADCIEHAVDAALNDGLRTPDIVGQSDIQPLTCTEMTDAILARL